MKHSCKALIAVISLAVAGASLPMTASAKSAVFGAGNKVASVLGKKSGGNVRQKVRVARQGAGVARQAVGVIGAAKGVLRANPQKRKARLERRAVRQEARLQRRAARRGR